MNRHLANMLSKRIAAACPEYFSSVAGLVQTIEYTNETSELIKIPVAIDSNIDMPSAGLERALVPDSSKKGILYFEDGGARRQPSKMRVDFFESSLTVVGWMNREKITGNKYSDLVPGATFRIIECLKPKPFNDTPFVRVFATVESYLPSSADIFSRYTYDERVTQYLMPPFDFFALGLRVSYGIPQLCLPTLI